MNNAIQPQQPKKSTIYRPTNEIGIRSIWDWSEKTHDYTQRKNGSRYQAYIEKNGKTKSASFGSIHDAIKWRLKIKVELDKIPDFDYINFKTLFEAFVNHQKKHVCITTLETYFKLKRHIGYFDNFMVEDINYKTIDSWIKLVTSNEYRLKMCVKAARTSYIKEAKLLQLMFNHYREYFNGQFIQPTLKRHRKDSVFKRDVFEARRTANSERYIESDDIEKLITVFKNQSVSNPKKYFYYLSCLVQLRSGLRVGEVYALYWQDINWETGVLKIRKTVQWRGLDGRPIQIGDAPKNRRNRTIFFIPEVLQELKQMQKSQSRISGLIFSDDGVKIKSYSSILHAYNYAFEAANIKFTATHILRHSFATDFKATVADDKGALRGILGHSSEQQTAHYAKTTEKTSIEGLKQYGRALEIRNT